MKFKVMIVYPNIKGMNMIPYGIALMSAVLKRQGNDVKLFDTTQYESIDGIISDTDQSRIEGFMIRPYTMPEKSTLNIKTENCFDDFEREVNEFQPDLLCLSSTEDMFLLGIKLLRRVRHLNILTVAGGVFATFAPNLVLTYPEIDIVCKGEGEDALSQLCERLEKKKPYDDIFNLWIKKQDGSIKINQTRMVDIDKNPLIDLTIFDEARLYRPMSGKIYRMLPVETHRGCPYKCTFCCSPSKMRLYREEVGESFLRRKSFKNLRREMMFYKNEMQAEYLYFWTDNFFSWKKGEFEEFAEIYKDIGLPFHFQTRIETVSAEKLKLLREIGCARIAFGIEHGNEPFRKKWIQRPVTNQTMIKNFRLVKDSGIPFSVNNILGFPHETYTLALDTIRFNRHVDSDDRNAYMFTPFHGTPLRDECERLGFINSDDIVQSVVGGKSLLDMPQFPKKQIEGLIKTFNMYVKFPDSRWPEIKKAEAATPEGRKIYDELKEEFQDKFFNVKDQSFESVAVLSEP